METQAPDALVEALARRITARKMMLINDPLGLRLPAMLWSQFVPQAENAIEFLLESIDRFSNERRSHRTEALCVMCGSRIERAIPIEPSDTHYRAQWIPCGHLVEWSKSAVRREDGR